MAHTSTGYTTFFFIFLFNHIYVVEHIKVMIFISLNSKSIYASEEAYRIEKLCIKIFPLSSKTNYAPKGKEKEWFSFMYINS